MADEPILRFCYDESWPGALRGGVGGGLGAGSGTHGGVPPGGVGGGLGTGIAHGVVSDTCELMSLPGPPCQPVFLLDQDVSSTPQDRIYIYSLLWILSGTQMDCRVEGFPDGYICSRERAGYRGQLWVVFLITSCLGIVFWGQCSSSNP